MNLLYANDARGAYPASWYAATVPLLDPFPVLNGTHTADVCIVGAGYTGLTAALTLAQAGRRVILLEAQRVGFGASGRNGGQLGSGQRVDQVSLEKMIGTSQAQLMWRMGEDAKTLVKTLISDHAINCDIQPGVAWAATSAASARDMHDYAEHMAAHYNYQLARFDQSGFQSVCPSPLYSGGILDTGAAHLNPLAYVLGLARAANEAGAIICEGSEAIRINQGTTVSVHTSEGMVTADHLILACNGYLGALEPHVASRVMPINNFIVATEPLGDKLPSVLPKRVAVCDDHFVVNYFRSSPDGRLLFGGGETYSYQFPQNIAQVVQKPLIKTFPHLRDIRIDYAWGGTLAITRPRLPYLVRRGSNVLSASGFSGHGVGNATQAGHLMARAIMGESDGFDAMSALPNTPFPGGAGLRTPLLMLAMSWFALRDRLGF